METVSDIVCAIHEAYPQDRYGYILIALMDYAKANNLRSVSFDDALYFYENFVEKKAGEIEQWGKLITTR